MRNNPQGAWPRYFLVIAGVVLLSGAVVQAATIPWSNPSGSNAAFGWSGGLNNTGLFGSPAVTIAGFLFSPTPGSFRANGGGGGSGGSVTDYARATVNVATSSPPNASTIHAITVEEWGIWSGITLPSDYGFQLDFQVFRLVPTPIGNTGSLTVPVVFDLNGTWHAIRTLVAGTAGNPPFSNVDWSQFQITVTNTIQVNGTAPAGSYIEKSGMRIITPEPASMALLLGGVVPLALRRRRA